MPVLGSRLQEESGEGAVKATGPVWKGVCEISLCIELLKSSGRTRDIRGAEWRPHRRDHLANIPIETTHSSVGEKRIRNHHRKGKGNNNKNANIEGNDGFERAVDLQGSRSYLMIHDRQIDTPANAIPYRNRGLIEVCHVGERFSIGALAWSDWLLVEGLDEHWL